jgi:predicted nucleotidyltransferase
MRALGPRLAELCQKYGIAELSVFGSIVRDAERPDSDVDLLYARLPGNDLGMSYFALQENLEKLFGRPVDLVPKDGLHWVLLSERYVIPGHSGHAARLSSSMVSSS